MSCDILKISEFVRKLFEKCREITEFAKLLPADYCVLFFVAQT